MNEQITVGLFGTCGNNPWRDPFIEQYDTAGINWFNPDAGDNWHPGMIDDENHHLQTDDVILFPVLEQTTGFGSLGEIGFSISNVVRKITNGHLQYLIVLIDDDCKDDKATEQERKHSIKTRKLVKSKLLEVNHPMILVVHNLADMLTASIHVCNSVKLQRSIGNLYRVNSR